MGPGLRQDDAQAVVDVSFSLRHSQPRHPVSKRPQNWHSL